MHHYTLALVVDQQHQEVETPVQSFKKMAGTSAVFVLADSDHTMPMERSGMVWSAAELHAEKLPEKRHLHASMANVLALEGLEEYDPASNGDVRWVESIEQNFIYLEEIRGWVQLAASSHPASPVSG